jgi:hypothetical protein
MTRSNKLSEYLMKSSFFKDPASASHHLAQVGGLATHSYNVFKHLERMTQRMNLRWNDPESIFIIAMAHDLCKMGSYIEVEGATTGIPYYIKNPDQPDGHGELSLSRITDIIPVTTEEIACIRWHMGAFDVKENWSKYTDAIHKYPNVLWVHQADMMAAHVTEYTR